MQKPTKVHDFIRRAVALVSNINDPAVEVALNITPPPPLPIFNEPASAKTIAVDDALDVPPPLRFRSSGLPTPNFHGHSVAIRTVYHPSVLLKEHERKRPLSGAFGFRS